MQLKTEASDNLSSQALIDVSDDRLMSRLADATDRETFNRLFEEFFRRYNTQITRWCYRLAKDHDRANDLAQEIFFKVSRSLHTFRGDSHLSTWLYVITRNHCLNRLKRLRRQPTDQASQLCCWQFVSCAEDIQAILERAESYERTFEVLRSILTPREIQVIVLHHVYEMTLPAITRLLLFPNQSGAKAYIVSAKRKLKLFIAHTSKVGSQVAGCSGEKLTPRKAA